MKLKRTSAPLLEPITLQEARDHLRVTTTGENTVIGFEISDARTYLEKQMSVLMMACGYEGYLDCFPDKPWMEIPLSPVTGVISVEYFAPGASVLSTLASSNYIFDDVHRPPRINLAPNCNWPSTEDRVNAVKIKFNAGYNSANDVPENWKRALKLVLTNFHEHRGDEGLVTLPKTISDMIFIDTLITV